MKTLGLFFRLSRPIFLAGGILMYALGAGLAHYLGATMDWHAYLLGQSWVILIQLCAQYLNEYYDSEADQENQNRTFLTGGSGAMGPDMLPRRLALMSALTSLAILASITVLLISYVKPGPETIWIMVLAFLGAFFYSTPPVRLEATGYGEIVVAFMLAFMLPSFAFLLQTGEVHRLLAMTGFPLAALILAMLLAFELPDFANDLKFEKRTLMVRLGWQIGMGLHNILILTAFLILLLARLFGLPWFAMAASLLTLPVGLFQIWQMRNIANGKKPNWNALTIGGLALFTLTAYMQAYAFWTN
jgi:1,4-dihydroxy-2-naphthoate polyprenyltransferase